MIAAPLIEPATLADIEALGRLREDQGWQRSEPLLRAVLSWEHGRIFVIRARSLEDATQTPPDEPVGTISAIAAGAVGVIGNVIVRADAQRRGLGKLLTQHAIAWQHEQGVRASLLDATPSGRPLYASLGFVEIAPSWVAHTPIRQLEFGRLEALAGSVEAHPASLSSLDDIAALDLAAFGGDRLGLLKALPQRQPYGLFVARDRSLAAPGLTGYALVRPLADPYIGVRAGPVVALDQASAAALTLAAAREWRRRLPAETASGEAYLTVGAGGDPRVRMLFDAIGAQTIDDDIVMRLLIDGAEPPATDDKEGRPSIYSWIAPMLF